MFDVCSLLIEVDSKEAPEAAAEKADDDSEFTEAAESTEEGELHANIDHYMSFLLFLYRVR